MITRSLAEMTAEVREVNTALGWRGGDNTFGDYIALLHSELSEALEAYRDHRLADATAGYDHELDRPAKPEGIGSEFADVLIRLLDTCDVYGVDLEFEYARKIAYNRTRPYQHGGRTLADGPVAGSQETTGADELGPGDTLPDGRIVVDADDDRFDEETTGAATGGVE